MKYNIVYVKPDYYDKFQCIGSDCRNNCCHYKWHISIDKKAYKQYRNFTSDKDFVNKFKNNVIVNENPIEHDYAHIKHLENPIRCPFEDENNLCIIHQKLGAESLSYTCKTFPRITTQYSPLNSDIIYIEKSLNAGCEVVVNSFLNNKEMMIIETEQKQETQNQIVNDTPKFLVKLKEEERPMLKYYYQIKSICIAILQNRELSFEDRLILLGFFLDKINKIEQEKNENTVEAEIELFINSIDEKSFAEVFKDIKSDYNRQLLISELMFKLFKNEKEEVFGRIEERVNKNLQFDAKHLTDEEKIPLIVEQYKRYLNNYNNFMSDKQHFIENLFVNEFFRTNMPFKNKINIYENFQYITMLFVAYRYIVSYYMGYNEKITDNELIDITTYFGRTFMNDGKDPRRVIEFLGKDFLSLAEMVLLIK